MARYAAPLHAAAEKQCLLLLLVVRGTARRGEAVDIVGPCSNLVIRPGTLHTNEIRATVNGAAELDPAGCNQVVANCRCIHTASRLLPNQLRDSKQNVSVSLHSHRRLLI